MFDVGHVALFIAFLCAVAIIVKQRGIVRETKYANEACLDMLNDRRTTAQKFATSCRLINISRTPEQMLILTFQRLDDIFTIDTIGQMSDDVATWRTRAGLGDNIINSPTA